MGKKHICKRPPVESYDLAGAERWLEEMAAQGLTLRRWGTWRCKFAVGEPRAVRCRLDPNRIKGWSPGLTDEFEELKESYRAMGWEYVCSISGFYLFESVDPAAPELYTDPESKALALRLLTRKSVRDAVVYFLLGALLLWSLRVESIDAADFFLRHSPRYWICVVVFPFMVLDICRRAWLLLRMRGALRRGQEPPGPSRRHLRFARFFSVLTWLALCVIIVCHVVDRGYDRQRVIVESNAGLPGVPSIMASVPALEELEGRGDLRKEDGYRWAHPLEGNYIAYEPSFLAPAHVQLSQEGTIVSLWWEDVIPDIGFVGRYHPHLAMELWELRYPSMAREFYDCRARQARALMNAEPLAVDGADEAQFSHSKSGARQIIVLRCGNRVAYIDYSGAGTLTDHLPKLMQMMSADWRTPEYLWNHKKGN